MGRRRWAVVSFGMMVGGYLALAALTQLASLPEGKAVAGGSEEYTLPSLEEVIQSVHDLDVQRVLRMYSVQHEEVPPGTPNVRVIVTSTWRSGSTFLGEILASHPGVYYHYEPLMPYGLQQLRPGPMQDEVQGLLQEILKCDYHDLDEYLKFAYVNHDMFMRNTRLWSMCSAMPRTKCYNADTLARLCSLFPVHVMKVVRARLELLAPLLRDPKVKLVWLVRDPRAVMSSRSNSVTWCDTLACKDPGYLCSDLMLDYRAYLLLQEQRPDQVLLVRYEDLARDPYGKSREVLEFAGLTFHKRVREYLDDHITSDEDEPWSTRHDPKTRVGRWMKLMKFDDVVKTQYHCKALMKNLGYRLFASPNDMDVGNAVGRLNLP
ncbi:carbohydrate sulfotransferase 1-like [Penaeus japonicus]|uniref:carbohydrate sulfotransferase 1-like n=1 Tax=Penaeus japonicus TaxID=27405 RepID=UPI001C70D7D0|nr:carbohydrate sulfotransferase 1-like [Penaeus japonicus]XP_042865601.1 carbohydrate sulfotransferase 1-like [Penaeus japonicus]